MTHQIFLSIALILSIADTANANVTVDGGFVVVKGKRFLAEVARTSAEHARGLMYRENLKSDRCMFFVYEQDSYHSIWMKNCLISLDVAWVRADGTVLETVENVPPCSPMRGDDCPSYGGSCLSRHFIEFPAGTFKRIGLKTGDKISWELELSNGEYSKGGPPIPNKSSSAKKKKKKAKVS
ncbi:MAG: DUF192 domain-containing protein [Holophagales bacterium]|jgi:uncharacterized membrane protein (UPF0127 family)|nr:DUF192 domain-containing protein [Holophagales bacterium]